MGNNGKGYKAQGKALPVFGVDSLVIKLATQAQAKHARHTGHAIAPKELKVYGFTLRGFFKA